MLLKTQVLIAPFAHLHSFFRQKEAVSIGIVFFLQSAIFAAWLVHIPYVKNRLSLSEGDLGAVLFGLPVGLLIMNPFSGWITERLGAVRTTIIALVSMLCSVWLPIFSESQTMLFVSLFVLGLAAALTNVAMNTCATLVEAQNGQRILSTCHGIWSLGNLCCSALLGMSIAYAVPVVFRFGLLSVLVLVVLGFAQKELLNIKEPPRTGDATSSFVRPNLQLLLLIFIGISVTMGEGLAFDWSGVYLQEVAGAPASLAAFGLSAFAALMAVVRLLGDWLLDRWEGKQLLFFGGLAAVTGILICVFLPNPLACFVGLLFLGGGIALGSPILYAASMRIEGVKPSAGLATFASLSFLGFLTAPPLIGVLGEYFDLKIAFGCIAFVLLLGALTTRSLK